MCFFFNDTATTEIYTLSLHDALPIYKIDLPSADPARVTKEIEEIIGIEAADASRVSAKTGEGVPDRSEEHTSELQSRQYLVCRLLLEKKKKRLSDLLLHVPPTPTLYS